MMCPMIESCVEDIRTPEMSGTCGSQSLAVHLWGAMRDRTEPSGLDIFGA